MALIANPQHPGETQELDAARGAAAKLGMVVSYFPVNGEVELDAAFGEIARSRDDAILAFADGFTMSFASRIAAFSLRQRIGHGARPGDLPVELPTKLELVVNVKVRTTERVRRFCRPYCPLPPQRHCDAPLGRGIPRDVVAIHVVRPSQCSFVAQQCLYLRPLPQGHASLRPIFGPLRCTGINCGMREFSLRTGSK